MFELRIVKVQVSCYYFFNLDAVLKWSRQVQNWMCMLKVSGCSMLQINCVSLCVFWMGEEYNVVFESLKRESLLLDKWEWFPCFAWQMWWLDGIWLKWNKHQQNNLQCEVFLAIWTHLILPDSAPIWCIVYPTILLAITKTAMKTSF